MNLIRTWRIQRGWSQAELARRVCRSQPTVSEWERGSKRPDLASCLLLQSVSGGELLVESLRPDFAGLVATPARGKRSAYDKPHSEASA